MRPKHGHTGVMSQRERGLRFGVDRVEGEGRRTNLEVVPGKATLVKGFPRSFFLCHYAIP